MKEKIVPLYLLTGFLGSGKTSVLNNILEKLKNKKVGLILNDFGPVIVDDALINKHGGVVSTRSLHGGQIFCDCLSGSFVQSVVDIAARSPDFIFVEASGLAKPSTLTELVSWVSDKTHGIVTYSGMICVVDAQRYPVVAKVLKTVEEQIVFSDWFILNKIDLVDDEALKAVVTQLRSLHPNGHIYYTTYGKIGTDFLDGILRNKSKTSKQVIDGSSYVGWGEEGRPKSFVLSTKEGVAETILNQFFQTISPSFLRVKGFLRSDDGLYRQINGVGPNVTVVLADKNDEIMNGVMCIYRANFDGQSYIRQVWSTFDTAPSLHIEE